MNNFKMLNLCYLTYLAVLLTAFIPFYETNDDVIMSLISSGIGIVDNKEIDLIYSSSAWGYFINFNTYLFGDYSYYLSHLIVVIASGLIIANSLMYFTGNVFLSFLLISLFITRLCVFPQFTHTAGIACIASVSCYSLFLDSGKRRLLTLSFLMSFFSCIIRLEMFIVISFFSFITIFSIIKSNKYSLHLISFLLIACILLSFNYFVGYGPNGEDWELFNHYRRVGVALSDYSDVFSVRTGGVKSESYMLITNRFFIDSEFLPIPKNIEFSILDNLNVKFKVMFYLGLKSLESLKGSYLFPLLLTILLLVMKFKSKFGMWLFMLLVVYVFGIGFFGRPGIHRIFYSPLFLFITLFVFKVRNLNVSKSMMCMFLLIVMSNIFALYNKNKNVLNFKKANLASYNRIKPYKPIIWGGDLRVEKLVSSYKVNELKWMQHFISPYSMAPYSKSYKLFTKKKSFLKHLKEKEVYLVLSSQRLQLIKTYIKASKGCNFNSRIISTIHDSMLVGIKC